MIIDRHAHAWYTYPYQPQVPDPAFRSKVEQLIYEMDTCGVDKAVIIVASIEHNSDNNEYIAEAVRRYPDRLIQFADIDCEWSSTYHLPGSAKRLQEAVDRYHLKGFTHYLSYEDEGAWLISPEGKDFFRTAAENKLIASICCYPHQHPSLRKMAEQTPDLPILCHHLGQIKADEPYPRPMLQQVLDSARIPNIYIKISGFGYASKQKWGFPYVDVAPLVQQIYERYGSHRMCWGSDYPVVRYYMTYRQSLETFRSFYPGINEEDKSWILGKTIAGLFSQ